MNDAALTQTLAPEELALLKRRALRLTLPVAVLAGLVGQGELLVARLGVARYAMRLRDLTAVTLLPRIASIPQAPRWVAGLAHEHGRILTVVDLGALAGNASPLPLRFALLVEVNNEPFAIGVSELEGLVKDWADTAEAIPPGVSEAAKRLIDGVSPNGICRLSLPRLLSALAEHTSSPNGAPEP